MKWDKEQVRSLYELSFLDLLFQAQAVHRDNFNSNEIELCSLLSIKTGSCPEDCAYCPQSAHYKTEVKKEELLSISQILMLAKAAKTQGAHRFCMGAAWRSPKQKDFEKVIEIIKAVKETGLEVCLTLGMLTKLQAEELKLAGLDFYNHNLDTSPNYYEKIITTRTYQDRIDTLEKVADAGIQVCCGGIIGMGDSREDRIELLIQLTKLPYIPKSVPINRLVRVEGTPLANVEEIDDFEFIRTIAIARIMLPKSVIRLSAGRSEMKEEAQALCFIAGANSFWLGDKLLTTKNREINADIIMLNKLGMKPKQNTDNHEYIKS